MVCSVLVTQLPLTQMVEGLCMSLLGTQCMQGPECPSEQGHIFLMEGSRSVLATNMSCSALPQ